MLRGFSVENFKSFDSTQSISMVASKIVRHKTHVRESGNYKLLKSAMIFGANAGGKSNLIKAVEFSRTIILSGLDAVNLSNSHFRILNERFRAPGVFVYSFVLGDLEYEYGLAVAYDRQEIVSEWLVRSGSNKSEFCIFQRDTDDDGNSVVDTDVSGSNDNTWARLNVYFEDYGKNISYALRKKTILADVASRSSDATGVIAEIIRVYESFMKMIIIFPDYKYNQINEIASNDQRRSFFQDILRYFDTGIETIESQSQQMDLEKLINNGEINEKTRLQLTKIVQTNPVIFRVDQQVITLRKGENGEIVYNKLLLDHGNAEDRFDYQDESDGTKRLFDLIPLLEIDDTTIILIDEIDRSLHTNLTRKFIEIFFEKTGNNNTQLIATTQDPNIMDLELLRQDEIWFVERAADHSSRVYSLNKFKARFDKVVKNDYLIGRYGAIPLFNGDYAVGGSVDEG